MTAEGLTRVLRFTDARSVFSSRVAVQRGRQVRLALFTGGNGGSGSSWKTSVRLAGVGVSVTDACPRELLYLTVGDITMEYLQIDNQPAGRPVPHRRGAVPAAHRLKVAAGPGTVPSASPVDIGAIGSPGFCDGGSGRGPRVRRPCTATWLHLVSIFSAWRRCFSPLWT